MACVARWHAINLHQVLLQGTLVGLLAAFSYELSILQTASRLTSADAFRTLHALYRERTHPVAASYASAAPGSLVKVSAPSSLSCPGSHS